jgi:hypothetical protein
MVLVTPSPDGGEVNSDGTKKKKLTTLEKSDGRRLVEYLVVCSSLPRDPPKEGEDPRKEGGEWNLSTSFDDDDIEVLHGFKPVITARYPLYDHEDNPLHENVTFFCHPSGAIQLKKEEFMPKVRTRIEYAMSTYHLVSPISHDFGCRFIILWPPEELEKRCTELA